MAPGIAYDESGSLASYFGVTFLACVLVPSTYIVFRPAKRDPLELSCSCSKCQFHRAELALIASAERRRRFSRRIIPLLLGWLAFGYLCYTISVAPALPGQAVYDPYEILGIRSSADDKAIKKHYKKLSLQFHPDKIRLAVDQTMEEVEEKFVQITKAYKALTDEAIRENLAKYGNPDGPQQREDKIAIPRWVVEGKNSIWVLVAYGLLLGGGIPFVVGRWWFRQRRTTRDNILNPSAEYYFHSLKDDTDFYNLVTIFAGAQEFATLLDPKAASKGKMAKKDRKEVYGQVEELEKALDARRLELGLEESATIKKDSKVSIGGAGQRKARALIWAHLLRFELDQGLRNEQAKLLHLSGPLLNALANISQAHGWLKTSLLCLQLQSSLAQAVPIGASPIAQFPGVSFEDAEQIGVQKGYEGVKWLQKLVKGEVGREKEVLNETGAGEKGLALGQEAKAVASGWNQLDVVSAEFKVEGETVVPPSSIVNLVVKVRYTTPSSSSPAPAKSLPNGDSHIQEDGTGIEKEAVSAEAEKVVEKTVNLVAPESLHEGKKEKERVWPKNGYAHAPYWPLLRKPHYYVLLGDSKLDKVIVPPIRITDIPTHSSTSSASSPSPSPSPSMREFKLTFPAPPQPNLYSFILHLVSDTFLGADIAIPVLMKVEEPPRIEELNGNGGDGEDDGISDPEEDSLAGQMALMKGGRVKPSKVRNEYESSEEEYESDEEGNGQGASGDEDEEEGDEEEDNDGPRAPRGREGKAINEDTDSEEE